MIKSCVRKNILYSKSPQMNVSIFRLHVFINYQFFVQEQTLGLLILKKFCTKKGALSSCVPSVKYVVSCLIEGNNDRSCFKLSLISAKG